MRGSSKRGVVWTASTAVAILFLLSGCLKPTEGTSVRKYQAEYNIRNLSREVVMLKEALERTRKFAVAIQARVNEDLAAAQGKYSAETAVVQQRINELEQAIEDRKRQIEAEERARKSEMHTAEDSNAGYTPYYGSEEWKNDVNSGCCDHEG